MYLAPYVLNLARQPLISCFVYFDVSLAINLGVTLVVTLVYVTLNSSSHCNVIQHNAVLPIPTRLGKFDICFSLTIDFRFALFSFRLLDGYVQCMCCKSGLTDPRFI